MRLITANLLIILAMLFLAIAYRLKQSPRRISLPRRREPGRIRAVWLGLQIVFNSAVFAAGV